MTEEIRDLQARRETEDNQELVDQRVYQENQVYQDFLGHVERRDPKEKPGHKVPQECRVVEVLKEREGHQAQKETVDDRELKD